MSKAFTRESDDLPERSGRKRSASGLPPGALNYLTADGARRFRAGLEATQDSDRDRSAEIRDILNSATVVEPPAEPPESAVFGAKVTVCDADGHVNSHRIVGIDEVNFHPGSFAWTSPNGRALLGTEPGQRVTLEVAGHQRKFTVVRIEY